MNSKQQALYALLEERGYSYGLCSTAVRLMGDSREAIDSLIDFVYDSSPSEDELISRLADASGRLLVEL